MGQAEDDVSDVAVNDGIDQVLKDTDKLLPVAAWNTHCVTLGQNLIFFSISFNI